MGGRDSQPLLRRNWGEDEKGSKVTEGGGQAPLGNQEFVVGSDWSIHSLSMGLTQVLAD